MNGSFRIASVAGIGIFLHWTFLLLLGWITLQHISAGDGWQETAIGVLFTLAIFGCIVLHELGHALAARAFGIPTRDITLLPIGGVARLERIPRDPLQEFIVAIAGPAVNVVIAGLLLPLVLLNLDFAEASQVDPLHGDFAARLLIVNMILIVFNLLPAFPMDGGRVLRAVLASFLERHQATRIAAAVGQWMAIFFAIFAVVTQQWMLILLAGFVFFGARSEAQASAFSEMFRGALVRDAMNPRFLSLHPEDSIQRAIDEIRQGFQEDFPVAEGEQVIGILYARDLREAFSKGRSPTFVKEVMSKSVPIIDENTPLIDAVERIQFTGTPALLASRDGRLVGLLTPALLSNWHAFRHHRTAAQAAHDSQFDHRA